MPPLGPLIRLLSVMVLDREYYIDLCSGRDLLANFGGAWTLPRIRGLG